MLHIIIIIKSKGKACLSWLEKKPIEGSCCLQHFCFVNFLIEIVIW